MSALETNLNWEELYRPANRLNWRGRYDGPEARRFHEVTQCIDLRRKPALTSTPHSYAVIGFNCDAGIRRNQGRTGAAEGPNALRQSISNIPVDRVDDFVLYDIGDIVCPEDELEDAQAALGHVVSWVLDHGIKPVVMGGGHETAWGHYLGIAKNYPHANTAIVNLDAHFDIRPLLDGGRGNSGTPFTQIADHRKAHHLNFNYYCLGIQSFGNTPHMFKHAKQLGVKWVTAQEIWQEGMEKVDHMLNEILDKHDTIYLSIDMDVFAAAYAPGVSAPQPLGLQPHQVLPVITRLGRSGKVVSCDVVELSPDLDRDGMTAQLAASMIADYIHA